MPFFIPDGRARRCVSFEVGVELSSGGKGPFLYVGLHAHSKKPVFTTWPHSWPACTCHIDPLILLSVLLISFCFAFNNENDT